MTKPASTPPLLDRPLVLVLGTINAHGSPHSVPVWFRHDPASGTFRVWTDTERHWVRNLARDPRCALTIAEPSAPFGGYLASGSAHIHHDPSWVEAEIRAIATRYLPAPDVDAYVAQYPALRTIVEITPTASRSWERGY